MPGTAKETLTDAITRIAERAAAREGIEVWEVEVLGSGKQRLIRIYIDKPEGVTHADCELMSQQVGTVLDVEDVVSGSGYHLEVSSPGIERKLRKIEDFQRFTGQKVRVALREAIEGQRRFEARITGVEDTIVVLETAQGKSLRVRMDQIEKANLKYEW